MTDNFFEKILFISAFGCLVILYLYINSINFENKELKTDLQNQKILNKQAIETQKALDFSTTQKELKEELKRELNETKTKKDKKKENNETSVNTNIGIHYININ